MSKTIKLVIAGSRHFDNYSFLCQKMDEIVAKMKDAVLFPKPIEIISGMAKGADLLGKKWAETRGLNVIKRPALWDDLTVKPCVVRINKHGKKYNALAGPNRNRQMAEECDGVVAFWDGESTGTKNMIDTAKELNKSVIVIRYERT